MIQNLIFQNRPEINLPVLYLDLENCKFLWCKKNTKVQKKS